MTTFSNTPNFDPDVTIVMLWINGLFSIFIFFLTIHSIIMLSKNRLKNYFSARHYNFTLLLLIVSGIIGSIFSIFETSWILLGYNAVWLWMEEGSIMTKIYSYLLSIRIWCWLFTLQLCSLRLYLLYYDINYNLALLDSKWLCKLHPSIYSSNKYRQLNAETAYQADSVLESVSRAKSATTTAPRLGSLSNSGIPSLSGGSSRVSNMSTNLSNNIETNTVPEDSASNFGEINGVSLENASGRRNNSNTHASRLTSFSPIGSDTEQMHSFDTPQLNPTNNNNNNNNIVININSKGNKFEQTRKKELENNFWLYNRKTYGNAKWMGIRGTILTAILFILIEIGLFVSINNNLDNEGHKDGNNRKNGDHSQSWMFAGMLFALFLWLLTMTGYGYVIFKIYKKLPDIYDSLHMKPELLNHFGTIFFVAIALFMAMFTIVTMDWNAFEDWRTCWLLYAATNIAILRIVYYSTYYVIKKCEFEQDSKHNNDQNTTYCLQNRCVLKVFTIPKKVNPIDNNAKNSKNTEITEFMDKNIKSWMNVVNKTEHGYSVFMRFIQNEFCSECLIFVTEYVEMRNVMIERLKQVSPKTAEDIEKKFRVFLTLSKTNGNGKMSDKKGEENVKNIILGGEQVAGYKNGYIHELEMFWYLYEKYIVAGYACMEINISYQLRTSITSLFDTKYWFDSGDYDYSLSQLEKQIKNKNDIEQDDIKEQIERINELICEVIPLFEKCACVLSKLLQDAFSRFRRTDECRELIYSEMMNEMQ